MTLNVRISGPLSEFVAANVGEDGLYENVSEYVRDLIRRDKERVQQAAFERLRAELQEAFAQPDELGREIDVEQFLAEARERNRARHKA